MLNFSLFQHNVLKKESVKNKIKYILNSFKVSVKNKMSRNVSFIISLWYKTLFEHQDLIKNWRVIFYGILGDNDTLHLIIMSMSFNYNIVKE